MKKTIHQFHANVVSRDAISANMFAIQKELRRLGYESEIFCQTYSEDIKDQIIPFSQYHRHSSPDQLLIIHYSIIFPDLDKVLALAEKKVLVYHNITPPEFFETLSPALAQLCREGREALLEFKGRIDLAVGDSEHNVAELKQMGFDGSISIPILLDYDKFAVQPDQEILAKYKSPGWVNWLFVGRVFPNKKQEDIIKAFYYFKKYICPNSRLILVGSYKDMPLYHEYLRYIVDNLGLSKDVILTGGVSESQLAAYYQAADLFMCMSEHEGFCVPLIEAIHAGVPVMAFDSTAVPETLGDTGVLIKEKRFPEIAELARYVLENTALRDRIVEEQKTRLNVYSRETVLQKWQQAINNFY